MLVLGRNVGEGVVITVGGTRIKLTVNEVRHPGRGDLVRIGFEAPPHVLINRCEIQDRIDAGEPMKRKP